jgi:DNA-binding XRE family transcriptional regulator
VAKRTRPEDAAWSEYAGELAANLRRVRAEAGLSREDIAYRSGLTRYTYQKHEKGESKPGTPANPTIRTSARISCNSTRFEMLRSS